MPSVIERGNPADRYRTLWPGWPDAAYYSIFYDSYTDRYFFRGTDGQIRRMPPQGSAFPQAWNNILGGGGIIPSGDIPRDDPNYRPPDQQTWPTGGKVPIDFSGGSDPRLDPYQGGPGDYAGGGQGGGSSNSWYNTFWGQSLINAVLNFVGGQLQDRATGKANQANQQAIKERIRQALAELSPDQIATLARSFMPQIMQQLGPLQQTALQGLATTQARQGLAGTPYGLTAEAGLRGQMANNASTQAFNQAMGLAGQRASAITGTPFMPQQPQTGLGDAFSNTANQFMLARAFSQRNQTPSTVYNFGRVGGPQPWEMQQTEGTPYQWPFNQGSY